MPVPPRGDKGHCGAEAGGAGIIAQRSAHQREVYQWEFLFLGANQDAIATSAQLSIAAYNAANIAGDCIGVRSANFSVARKTKALRSRSSGGKLSLEEAHDLAADLGSLAGEEDDKGRRKGGPFAFPPLIKLWLYKDRQFR